MLDVASHVKLYVTEHNKSGDGFIKQVVELIQLNGY